MFEIHWLVIGRYRNRSRPVTTVTGPVTTGKVNPRQTTNTTDTKHMFQANM
jgi:hypothetical protein